MIKVIRDRTQPRIPRWVGQRFVEEVGVYQVIRADGRIFTAELVAEFATKADAKAWLIRKKKT